MQHLEIELLSLTCFQKIRNKDFDEKKFFLSPLAPRKEYASILIEGSFESYLSIMQRQQELASREYP